MISQQQQPGAQPQAQAYQQYPPPQYQQPQQQYQQPPQQQYLQAPPQQYPPPQPQAPPAPQGPQKDSVVAEEFKKYVLSQTWQVLSHDASPGNHLIKLAPPSGRKLAKGDVKKAQITVKALGQPPAAPGAPPSGPNSIQVSLDTEEKAGFFGSDKKSYPVWMNVDEEVDATMQPTAGLKDKVRNICTQAKITMPAPQPQPAYQQPQGQAPGYPLQQQPGAPPQQPMTAPPPIPQATPQPSQAAPSPMQPTSQPTPPQPQQQYQAQPPPPAYQPQQQWAQPAQQQAPPQQWQQRVCPNPNCQAPNAANAATCYRCGYRLS